MNYVHFVPNLRDMCGACDCGGDPLCEKIPKRLAIVGTTGIGKTRYLMERLTAIQGRKVLLIRHMEQLIDIKKTYCTDIVFDDVSFYLAKPETLIFLCDRFYPAPVRILRNCVTIPTGVHIWFTHNCSEAYAPMLCLEDQQAAINRRLHVEICRSTSTLFTILNQCPCKKD